MAIVYIHCILFSIVNLNIFTKLGINKTPTCKIVPNINAPIKNLFSNIPHFKYRFFTFYIKTMY